MSDFIGLKPPRAGGMILYQSATGYSYLAPFIPQTLGKRHYMSRHTTRVQMTCQEKGLSVPWFHTSLWRGSNKRLYGPARLGSWVDGTRKPLTPLTSAYPAVVAQPEVHGKPFRRLHPTPTQSQPSFGLPLPFWL